MYVWRDSAEVSLFENMAFCLLLGKILPFFKKYFFWSSDFFLFKGTYCLLVWNLQSQVLAAIYTILKC